MHHPTDRVAHTTAFLMPVVEYWLGWYKVKNHPERGTHHINYMGYSFGLPASNILCASSHRQAFAHGAMGCRDDPLYWTHWTISLSSQCSLTGVTKTVVCIILSVMVHIKRTLADNWKVSSMWRELDFSLAI